MTQEKIDFEELMEENARHSGRKIKPKDDVIHVSEIESCIRKNYFHHKIFRQHPASTLKIFTLGNIVHNHATQLLRKHKKVAYVESEVETFMYVEDGDFRIIGTLDDLVHFRDGSELILEKKSTKFLPEKPNEHHVAQCNFYMKMRGISKGQIVYFEKNNMKTKSFIISLDNEMFKESMHRALDLVDTLRKKIIPAAEAKLIPSRGWECSFCIYKDVCDDLPNTDVKDVTKK